MTLDNFWNESHTQAEYLDMNKGSDDGSHGRPIPADASESYRRGYARSVKFNNRFNQIRNAIVSVVLAIAIPTLITSNRSMYQNSQAREQRIIEYYQAHGPCPHDLDAKGVDARAIMWNNEVEHPER